MLAFLLAAALGSFSVLDSAEHSSEHFTQGLFFDGKVLYESTGLYGASRLYRYPAPGMPASDSVALEARYFGEGSVKFGSDIFWLTWKEGVAFIHDAKTLRQKSSFPIRTKGWGLTLYQNSLVMSDGSETLYFFSPGEKNVFRTLSVYDGKMPVKFLNELEIADGILYANVWQSDSIAAIDPQSGKVLRWYDFSRLARNVRKRDARAEVLNGIAFDGKFFWITGKFWPVMYRVELKRE